MEKFKEAIKKIFAVIGTALVFSASAILKTCLKSVDDAGEIISKSLKAVDYGTVGKIADEPGEKLLKSSNLTSAGKSVSSTHQKVLENISDLAADLTQRYVLYGVQEAQKRSKTVSEITSEMREDVVLKMLFHNGTSISFTKPRLPVDWTLENANKFYLSGNLSKDEYMTILGEYMRVFEATPDEVIEAAKRAKW